MRQLRAVGLVVGLIVLAGLAGRLATGQIADNVLFTWIKNLDEPARQPVHFRAVPVFNGTFTVTQNMYTVPAGKRLVVEQAASYCVLVPGGQGTLINADLLATTGGVTARFPLETKAASSLPPAFTSSLQIAADRVRMYADAGSTVQVAVGFDRLVAGQCEMSGTGYLVNIE